MEQGVVSHANDPLKWWHMKRNSYPILSKCARIIYSVPAGAGPMELDIGHTGMISTKYRSSLAGNLVEAMTVLNRNRNLVDLVNVDSCTPDELNEKLPRNLAIESVNENATIFGALDVHFPASLHDEVSQMMDLIAENDIDE
jgi:hAT family C-terminal dimerisation region